MALSDYTSMFQRYSASSGIPYQYFVTTSGIETGGTWNPNAYNSGSGATGLFQFIPKTARAYNLTDATDAESSTSAFVRFTQDNITAFKNAFGRSPKENEMYLMHQQGATGAIKLLSNPDTPARDIVGSAAVTMNAGSWGMTAKQFADKWLNSYNSRSVKYGGTVPPSGVVDSGGNSPADWLQNITAGADPSKPFTPATPGEENSSGILGSISDFFGGSSTPFGIASTLFKGITGNSVADVATGAAPNTVSSDTQNILAFAENWAGRGIVIILGFIFVAVGLAMFAPKVIVNEVTKGAIRS